MTAGGLIFLGVCLIIAAMIVMSVRIYQVRPDFVTKVLHYMLIGIFWLLSSAASVSIGYRIMDRHQTTYTRGMKFVNDAWGGNLSQKPPSITYNTVEQQEFENQKTGEMQKRTVTLKQDIGFFSQNLNLKIDAKPRTKGLLKFPGYLLSFNGTYKIKNTLNRKEKLDFNFELPVNSGNVTDISITLDKKPYLDDANLADGIQISKEMNPLEEHEVVIQYKAQGTGSFSYSMGENRKEIKKLNAILITDFVDYNIHEKAMVPTEQGSDNKLTKITWSGENLITDQNISLEFKIEDYGSLASKLFFYAPLSLFLFLFSVVIFTVSKDISLHPMHYLFIIGGFFIFYLLGSYIISFVNVMLGIVISLAISTSIILYYMHLIKKGSNLFQATGASALIFQWVFSMAFFFPEYTGLLITLASILSFVGLMKVTADTEWEKKF